MVERIKILHVEDDDMDYMSVMRVFRNEYLPYKVERAVSVSEALRKVETIDYDLVLLDFNLPILLPETPLKSASELAERLRKVVETMAGVTVSLGVSSLSKDMLCTDDLIKRADEALYRAKEKGRNRVQVAG